MPDVVSDTSPIQYLHQIGHLDLLRRAYRRILLPRGVVDELEVGRQLGIDLPEIESIPWIEVREVQGPKRYLRLSPDLGQGEKETLALALEFTSPLVILDDALARRQAGLLEIRATGTLGVLLKAKARHDVAELGPLLDRLAQRGFRLHNETRRIVLQLAGEQP